MSRGRILWWSGAGVATVLVLVFLLRGGGSDSREPARSARPGGFSVAAPRVPRPEPGPRPPSRLRAPRRLALPPSGFDAPGATRSPAGPSGRSRPRTASGRVPVGHAVFDFERSGRIDELGSGRGLTLTSRGLELEPGDGEGAREGVLTSRALAPSFPINAAGPQWKADLPVGSAVRIELAFSEDGDRWGPWYAVAPQPHGTPSATYPDGRPNPHYGFEIGTLVTHGTRRFSFYRYRIRLRAERPGVSPALARLRVAYLDSTRTE